MEASIAQPGFVLLQSAGIIGALLFAGGALLLDARARRIGNLLRLTEQHRELWERMFFDPALARILRQSVDLSRKPITPNEQMFVMFIILHLSGSYYAMKTIFMRRPEGLRRDIELFFSLPIPKAVWLKARDLQDKKFVQFVTECLGNPEEN